MFFSLGSLAAVIILPYWLLLVTGHVSYLPSYFSPFLWHLHEMIFGMVMAIIIGFIYTAVPNWTGRRTPTGLLLALLGLLWISGRVAVFFGGLLPSFTALIIDGIFLPLAVVGIMPALVGASNKRNYFLPLILMIFAVFNVCLHLSALEILNIEARQIYEAALLMVVLLMNVIGGRIIPAFTSGKYPELKLRSIPFLLPLSVVLIASLMILRLTGTEDGLAGVVAFACGLVTLARLYCWKGWKVCSDPLLLILHLGYGWIVVGFFLIAVGLFNENITLSYGLHAFSVGAVGSLTLGVMTRASLGHSGLPLKNEPLLTGMFIAINLAAFSRSLLPLLLDDLQVVDYTEILNGAGLLWVVAYGIFLVRFMPLFFRPRT